MARDRRGSRRRHRARNGGAVRPRCAPPRRPARAADDAVPGGRSASRSGMVLRWVRATMPGGVGAGRAEGEMRLVRIAAYQLPAEPDGGTPLERKERQVARALAGLDEAGRAGADLA